MKVNEKILLLKEDLECYEVDVCFWGDDALSITTSTCEIVVLLNEEDNRFVLKSIPNILDSEFEKVTDSNPLNISRYIVEKILGKDYGVTLMFEMPEKI